MDTHTQGRPARAPAVAKCSPSAQDAAIEPTMEVVRGRVRRWACIALAGMLLALGLIGIVVPGLPTTPFVLLASLLLANSSPRFHQRLLASRVFGPVLRDWELHRGVRPQVKFRAALFVVAAVGLMLFVRGHFDAVVAGVIALAAVGLLVIHRLPSVGDSSGGESRVHDSASQH